VDLNEKMLQTWWTEERIYSYVETKSYSDAHVRITRRTRKLCRQRAARCLRIFALERKDGMWLVRNQEEIRNGILDTDRAEINYWECKHGIEYVKDMKMTDLHRCTAVVSLSARSSWRRWIKSRRGDKVKNQVHEEWWMCGECVNEYSNVTMH
jgi:hypothetical protein